ncbi:MAG: M15 family metallopeptidase [Eubacterium sp.]|jgi:D-alanyl-D-alanine carboxypeptidase|nr:M15 family metallopeptidase [Eubacterium sp.]
MMSQKTIFFINLIFITLFCGYIHITGFNPKETEEAAVIKTDGFGDEFAFFLINHDNPLPKNFKIERSVIQDGFEMDARCAGYAMQMLEDAKKDGITLKVCSAYRSPEEQTEIFDKNVEMLIKKKYDPKEAERLTLREIAAPYESEHNCGLAMDLITEDWFINHDDLNADFEYTGEFKWLSANAWKYGFILRYPKGRSDITGIIYEPWHYRFVGLQKAEQIYCSNLTLEEYIERYA